jgi:hypothetical protein
MQRTLLAIGLTILFVARSAAAPETIDPAQAKADAKDLLLWYDIRLLREKAGRKPRRHSIGCPPRPREWFAPPCGT